MVIPIGDRPNPRGVPWVTHALIAVNVAVFALLTLPLATIPADLADPRAAEYLRIVGERAGPLAHLQGRLTAYDLFVFDWGFRAGVPSLRTLLASMFLHAGALHLFGNMLFLWIYGDNVEHRLGAVWFVGAYLCTGAAATLTHAAVASDAALPMIGASGAISGVLGFYFVWFPRNVVRLMWLLPPLLFRVFEVPARVVLALYLVLDNLLPSLLTDAAGGVAYTAHLGGFATGVVLAWAADRGGRPARAEDGTTLATLRHRLRTLPAGRERAELHVRIGDLLLHELEEPVSAYQHYRAALEGTRDADVMAAARRGVAEVQAVLGRR